LHALHTVADNDNHGTTIQHRCNTFYDVPSHKYLFGKPISKEPRCHSAPASTRSCDYDEVGRTSQTGSPIVSLKRSMSGSTVEPDASIGSSSEFLVMVPLSSQTRMMRAQVVAFAIGRGPRQVPHPSSSIPRGTPSNCVGRLILHTAAPLHHQSRTRTNLADRAGTPTIVGNLQKGSVNLHTAGKIYMMMYIRSFAQRVTRQHSFLELPRGKAQRSVQLAMCLRRTTLVTRHAMRVERTFQSRRHCMGAGNAIMVCVATARTSCSS